MLRAHAVEFANSGDIVARQSPDVQDLSTFCDRVTAGTEKPLPPLPRPYAVTAVHAQPEGWPVSIVVDHVQPRSSVVHGVGFPLDGCRAGQRKRTCTFSTTPYAKRYTSTLHFSWFPVYRRSIVANNEHQCHPRHIRSHWPSRKTWVLYPMYIFYRQRYAAACVPKTPS